MTQPPEAYPPPPPEPGRRDPTPADPFSSPPWDQPTQPGRPVSPTPYGQPGAGPGHRPPYGTPPYGTPQYGTPQYGTPQYGTPQYGTPQYGTPQYGTAPYGPPPEGLPAPPAGPPRRRRRALLIWAVVLAGVLVLAMVGGVGAWLLTRDPDRDGAQSPAQAVQQFLIAVYQDLDPVAAAARVCSEARDEEALATKINEIRAYEQTALKPTFSWSDPSVVNESGELAVMTVTVTMTTDDEKTAQQTLHVSVLDKDPHGWWVCDLETVQDPAEGASPSPSPGPDEEAGG